jgi:hypothetical protein
MIYAHAESGTVRTRSEYAQHDEDHPPWNGDDDLGITMPVLVGLEANTMTTRSQTGAKKTWTLKPKCQYRRKDPIREQLPNINGPALDSSERRMEGREYSNEQPEPSSLSSKQTQPVKMKAEESELIQLVQEKRKTNLLDVIQHGYPADRLLKTVLEKPKHYKNFVIIDKMLYIKENGKLLMRIPENVVLEGHTL